MRQTKFFTLTTRGAVPVKGYFDHGFGYYRNCSGQWFAIHGDTGIAVAMRPTLKAAKAAVQAKRAIIAEALDNNEERERKFLWEVNQYLQNGGTI